MTKKESLKLFEDKKVRTVWDSEQEKWYFAIVDVVAVLTDSVDASAYWRKLKQRLRKEGNETVTNCHGLKMQAADGKMRLTDVADTEQLFRLIQSVPSPQAFTNYAPGFPPLCPEQREALPRANKKLFFSPAYLGQNTCIRLPKAVSL